MTVRVPAILSIDSIKRMPFSVFTKFVKDHSSCDQLQLKLVSNGKSKQNAN